MSNQIKTKALEYLNHKISVIPCDVDKKPLVSWKEYQSRLATKEELEQWFNKFPDMQIGIVTGKISGLIIVDIDDPMADLSWLPITAVVQTGSGGFHYYYKYSVNFKNKARIKENIDIRAEGGYVIAPPSRNKKGEYKLVNKMELQPFPAHLFYKVDKPVQQYVKTEFTGFSQGNRNHEMTRYIGHLLAKIHPTEWQGIGWRMACEANQKNEPPMSEPELKIIFDSISNAERNNTTQRWYKKQEPEKNIGLQIKKNYLCRYTWGTNELDGSLAIIKRGNFIIVGAKRSSGKTTFTFDMACKNALLGHKVLYISLEMEEEKIIEDFARKYAGITVEEEYHYQEPETKINARNRKIKEIKSIEGLFFRGMRRGNGTSWDDITKIIKEFSDIDLIFIDNLDLIEGATGETNNDRQIRITKRIMNFTEEYQVPVVLIHHHRKGGGAQKDYGSDELSGSGKIGDNADIILKISRNQNLEAEYPEKYKTTIFQQKGRGYPDAIKSVYFIKGTFEDLPPNEDIYYSYNNSINRMEYINK